MNWLKDIKVIVLDLDGTLYQDHTFFNSYLDYIFGQEDSEIWKNEVDRILSGQHALKIGHFYDPNNRVGLTHSKGQITGAYEWESSEQHNSLLPKPTMLPASENQVIYLGDAWSVVGAICAYANIPEARRQQAFAAVRSDMVAEKGQVKPYEKLIRAVQQLNEVDHKLLMTNSPEDTARDFVKVLGLNSAFDRIIFGGEKPQGLASYLKELIQERGIHPEEIMTIGDHAWNDLYPVKRLGGRTVWISPYVSWDNEEWDIQIKTLDELSDLLIKIQNINETNSLSI
jgi:FMN phosphatase YigB (HAD superfamily)